MGINISCDIKVKNNYKKINNITEKIPQIVNKTVEKILKNIQGCSIRLERGHNSNGILVEMIENSTGKVKGKVYADPNKFMGDNGKSYLWFEYIGTGAMAEQPHIGKTKHFIESGYTEWYIPVNKVGRNLNYPIITLNNQQFYVATGAKGNHFLSDAEFETRSQNIENMKKQLNNMFKEVCR